MKSIIKRGMSALSAAALAASMAAALPVSVSADTINADTQAFLKSIGAGWCLGNTFDGNKETGWQPDITTKEAIEAVHDAGFETIRIPISWGGHMSGDYKIDQAWLDRIHEVVDWAYNDGMHVIINIHHDNLTSSTASNKFGFYPDSAHKDSSIAFVNSIWKTLAEEYKDYDEKLIFETLNEPRLAGTRDEWWIDPNNPNANAKDAVATIDAINQEAVNTIRAAGGKNTSRYIICPGYSASISGALLGSMPKDPVSSNDDKILRSIHCYDPNNLCLGSQTDHTSVSAVSFDAKAKSSLQDSFSTYKSIADSGIPVIIDEMGISDKENNSARAEWAAEAFRLAKEYNTPCVLWDNNASFTSGSTSTNWSEHHRHLNRKNGKWVDPDVINAIMDSTGVTKRTITADESVKAKKSQTISGVSDSYSKTYGAAAFELNAKTSGDGKLSYESSDTSVVTVTSSGKVTIKDVGTATITVTATETANYTSASKTVKITVGPQSITPTIEAIPDQKYTGKAIEPAISVKHGVKKITSSYYTVSYKNNINPGTATVTVTLKGRYSGTATATFKITGSAAASVTKPGQVKISSVSKSTAAVRLNWKAVSKATGYRIERYTSKSGWTKVADIKAKSGTQTYKITKLSPASLYKYRVTAYTKSGSDTVWGTPSKTQSVITKPKAVKITKVSKTKNAVRLTWGKVSCTGYQVQKYDAAKKKWVTIKTIKNPSTTTYRISGLKKNTVYKLRVHAYKKSGTLKTNSDWTSKSVRTKKK